MVFTHQRTVAGRPEHVLLARRGLTQLAVFGAVGVGLSAVYAAFGVGIPCWFKLLTGWECPFCGATRMGAALLEFDLTGAFAWNPLVFVGLIALGLLGLVWLIELRRPLPRPPGWSGLRRQLSRYGPALIAAVLVGYTLVRNLT
ncbi:uncharacterized protein DUF2752 [Naumannella halotolerans]|uniref:Uncharacterized protein DUF2752 n=1 Tax=Naumannella halotolerans TaxID=993414 RepID=A0A4R7J7J1_9ACTN|nr:uncharacterized protein DUF2752 [Naumannella halotolerans]